MVCKLSVVLIILFSGIQVYGFSEVEIVLFEIQSEVESDLYAGDDVVYNGEIEKLDFRLSDFQLASLNTHELMLLRNAVYARRGYAFRNETILAHFEAFDWYEPEREDVSELLDETDMWNINLILYYEEHLESSDTGPLTAGEITGFWHGSESLGSGYSDRFFLFPEGRFVFRENQMNGAARLLELSGEWYLDENHLVLEADSAMYVINGEIEEPYASFGSDFVIDNGEPVYMELNPHEVFRLPLEGYFEGGEHEDYDYPLLPSMGIGRCRYWRMAADPNSAYLD